jgi:hypothetical protein
VSSARLYDDVILTFWRHFIFDAFHVSDCACYHAFCHYFFTFSFVVLLKGDLRCSPLLSPTVLAVKSLRYASRAAPEAIKPMQLEILLCVPAVSNALIVCLLGLRIGLVSLQRLAASLVGQWRISLPPLAFLDGSQSSD